MRQFRILLLVLSVVLIANLAMAQTETGQVTGSVLDPTGARIPKATVSLRSVSTGLVRKVESNDAGLYLFPGVLPGNYELTAEASGFSKYSQAITVTVGARVGADIRMEVGRAETVVQVTETAGQVNVETQTLATVVSRQNIENLPTLTRDPYDLVATAGNVSNGSPDGRGVGYSINGQRSSSTNVLLDGSANNNEFTATVGQSVPQDSVQEFSLLTSNFTAEYGRASGGVVNVVTKGGTNEFHGSAYEFNRVSRLASNDFDNNANELPKSTFVRNQFGYSIGGPIKKDKLFFFNNIEWFRVRSAARRTVWIPADGLINASAANTKNFFSTYGKVRAGVADLGTYSKDQLVAAGFNPCSNGMAGGACALLPGSTAMFRRLSYAYPADSGGGDPEDEYQLVARVDYNLSSATQLYGRTSIQKATYLAGVVADSPYAGFDTGQDTLNQNHLISLLHTFSPTLSMQSKVVFNRLNESQPLGEYPATPTLYVYGTTPASILGSSVGFPGYLPFSPGNGIPSGGPQNLAQLYQDFNYSRGKHQLRFGGSYTYIRDNHTFGAYMNSVMQLGSSGKFGNAIDNFLNGKAYSYTGAIDPQGKYPCGATVDANCTVTLPVGQPNFSRSNRYHEVAYYVQDSFKVSRSVTLSLGLRWEYFGVQHNQDPKLDSNFYLGSGTTYPAQVRNGSVQLAPNSPVGGLWGKDWNNYSPRLGFAWDVFGDGKTSVRGGWGMYYERNFGNVTFNVIQNPPNYGVISLTSGSDVTSIDITTAAVGPLAGSSGSKSLPKVSLRAVKQDVTNAYSHSFSLSIERALNSNVTAAVEYSGSKGVDLYSIENSNPVGGGNYYLNDPCTPDDQDCVARVLPYRYTGVSLRGQLGLSLYNSMNARLDVQSIKSIGLTSMRVNYTWGHAIDNLSDTFSSSGNQMNLGLLDRYNPQIERGNAYFDQRHRLAVSGTWDLPLSGITGENKALKYILEGWSFNPIFTARTGFPYSLYDCTWGYNACPYGFFDKNVTTVTGDSNGPALSTPNTNKFYDYTGYGVNSDYTSKVLWSDFGPFPTNMAGRNVFRDAGNWNLNLGLNKNVQLTERYRVQFRLETYNTFNHANLYADTSQNTTDIGYVPAYRSGNRNVQMALRFEF